LHQEHAALAAEPGAGRNADPLLLSREHRRFHDRFGMTQFDQACMTGVGYVGHLPDSGLTQLLENRFRPGPHRITISRRIAARHREAGSLVFGDLYAH
jgi:hypothetical protein